MMAFEQFWFEASLVIVPAAIVIIFLKVRYAATARRNRQMGVVVRAMADHKRAVELVLNDPATPDVIRDSLAAYSRVVCDPKMGHDLAVFIMSGELQKAVDAPEHLGSFKEDLASLRGTRPDLLSAFRTATMSGMIVTILRSPDTARRFEETMATLASDERRGIQAVKTSVSFVQKIRPSLNGGPDLAHC